ncbi:type II toxin -antitoxin system TacA 1-like antitoxin [Maribacter chungangensis]|uniref:type II toxin -antitoxin system TacA 1-like antitoxin n=1 Tax=Maribacter chungangensis TaxID=1069117 RepID=UPI0036D39FDE
MRTKELKQKKALLIIAESNRVIASKKDSEVFFDAITSNPKANRKLADAVTEYCKAYRI